MLATSSCVQPFSNRICLKSGSLVMLPSVHNAHITVKSKRTPIECNMHIMSYDDRPDAAKRLEQARIARGFSDAKKATTFFGWKYDTYAQHENGTRGLTRAAKQYAKAFRVSEAWLLTGEGSGPGQPQEVPLKGKVGAGAEVYALDNGSDDTVEAPAGAAPSTVAVEVSGDSMFPAYEDRTLLYYSKLLPPEQMLNRRCVVQLANGKIFVKVLRKGSGGNLYTLQSLNPLYSDITDQQVDWAAPIDWVKPR
ncbi:XRE family transcriptional regulator [Rhizobium daejeonense]|uniref:XRE family transcriptional regulator n=2 Tax=Rhizobium daejeonense TaxID=240521 RepID=UPI003CC807F7